MSNGEFSFFGLRPRRVFAVGARDLSHRVAGKGWYRMPLLALALLLPAGAIPLDFTGSTATKLDAAVRTQEDRIPTVDGQVPPALQGKVLSKPGAYVKMRGTDPVTVYTAYMSPPLRAALEELPGLERFQAKVYPPRFKFPARSMLVALLAISLLMGPLAESLPGERARKTLEVLLSAGITRGELIMGKWAAWTASASLTALIAAAVGIAAGVQPVGLWLLAMPMFIGCGVALGLWLVRSIGDVVGGAAAPMRVLPVVSLGLAGLAGVLAPVSTTLAAAVPIGGPLLVAGAVLDDPLSTLAAAVSSAAFIAFALAWTARDVAREPNDHGALRPGWIGISTVAITGWWLAVGGPGIWVTAGNPEIAAPAWASTFAGGILLAVCGFVATAREPGGASTEQPTSGLGTPAVGLVLALAVGIGLALGDSALADPTRTEILRTALPRPDWVHAFDSKLAQAVAPWAVGPAVAIVAVCGQGLIFRDVLLRRVGLAGATIAWALCVSPLDPVRGLIAGAGLTFLAQSHGLIWSLIAHLVWIIMSYVFAIA